MFKKKLKSIRNLYKIKSSKIILRKFLNEIKLDINFWNRYAILNSTGRIENKKND